MSNVKAVGNLIKTIAVKIDDIDADDFFRAALYEKLSLEETIFEWYEKFKDDGIILFPINDVKSQIDLMRKDIPYFYKTTIDDQEIEFIFLVEYDRLEIDSLKNLEELSGIGKIITPFDLKFDNFSKRFTQDNNKKFFEVENSSIILNNIKLIIDEKSSHILKLTGRAAELAKKRESLKDNNEK